MIKPIRRKEFQRVERIAIDALRMASTHDPDLLQRIIVMERQLRRLGAPQYRKAK